MITEEDYKKRCAEILRNNITFAGQIGDYVIHGALDAIWKLHTEQTDVNPLVSGSLPTDEDIVRWSNEVAELTDEQKEYTATGSRIAIQERCAGARWMLTKLSGQ